MKQKNIKFIALLFGVVIIVLIVALQFKRSTVSTQIVIGTVTSVVNKPNLTEDGYYGIELADKSGQKYTIDATGYLNTPASANQFGEVCIEVPLIKVGDKVEFNLPKSQDQQNTYNICYKKSLTGYYLKIH
jgi:hypothetical protein